MASLTEVTRSLIGPTFDLYEGEAKTAIAVIEDIKTTPTKRKRTISTLKRRVEKLQLCVEIIGRAMRDNWVSEPEAKEILRMYDGYHARWARMRSKYDFYRG